MNRHPGNAGEGITSQPLQHHNSSTQQFPQQQGSSTVASNPSNPATTYIFIPRDYRHGLSVKFLTDFPPELIGRIEQDAFNYTMNAINALFDEAEEMTCAICCESWFACLTSNAIYLCKDTHYEKVLKRLAKFLNEQNQHVYYPRGLALTNPMDRGLRCIEVAIHNNTDRMRS